MKDKQFFLFKSIIGVSIPIDGENKNYTIPRTYGVYEIPTTDSRRFRFGNHPVRENELSREFGGVKRTAVFLDREDARDFAKLLNS